MSSPRHEGLLEACGAVPEISSSATNKRTPPPEAARVRNPFEQALIHRLHTPICSPGMCKMYKKTPDGTFQWEIEQHCTLMPADIVACSSQFEPSPDPQLDRIHEEATERFFSQVVVPSPFEQTSKKVKPLITSSGSSELHIEDDCVKFVRDSSAQTVLTLPPHLPPEIEAILQKFTTYTQDQNMSSDLDTSDSWLRRKLEFEEHSDDEPSPPPPPPPQHYSPHAPVLFSPDLSRNVLSMGMKRTFGTPHNVQPGRKEGFHNKFLDGVELGEPCFSPIGSVGTPARTRPALSPGSSGKGLSSDDEKPQRTPPDCERMATCLDCVGRSPGAGAATEEARRRSCYCKPAGRSLLRRSVSMKESPARDRRRSSSVARGAAGAAGAADAPLGGKRSASMSSLGRCRSVQRLDFSVDMSVDGSQLSHSREQLFRCHSVLGGSDSSGSPKAKVTNDSTKFHSDHYTIDETPIKGRSKTNVLTHVISQIRSSNTAIPFHASPINMSLDNSTDESLPNLEDKKFDFNSIDLKLLTSGSRFDFTHNATERAGEATVSLKRLDSGFNENTTFFGKSSYYESAIKPSELTVTDFKSSCSSLPLKELSNVNWMRVDSGFKDETSSDNIQFYSEGTSREPAKFCFTEASLQGPDKENVFIEDFDKFLVRASSREEAMSISDIFADEMAMNCNFSSTPSKNKVRN